MNEVQVNSQGNVQSVDFTSQEPMQPQRSSQTEMMVTRQAQEVQVAMLAAKKFPRDQVVAYNNIMRACQRRKLAESSMYEFPRGNEKITGPSIRLAEAIAQNWGNIDFGFMELEQRNGVSQVMAYAWDLETNSRQTKLFSVPHIRHQRVAGMQCYIYRQHDGLFQFCKGKEIFYSSAGTVPERFEPRKERRYQSEYRAPRKRNC